MFLASLGIILGVYLISWPHVEFRAPKEGFKIGPGPKNSHFPVTLKEAVSAPQIISAYFLCVSGIFGQNSRGIFNFLAKF